MNINRGSEWKKWDLHIHSPYTHLNKYSCTDDEFIDRIKNHNIAVVGLTNYFNFTEEEYALKEKITKEGITVFLNLELRLSYQNKEDDCSDIHVIFDNNLTTKNIKDFLANLKLNLNGKEVKAKNIFSQEEFKKATVEFDNLLKTLNDNFLKLKNKYLIGFLSRGKGNARTSTQYEKLANNTHFLIHSSNLEQNLSDDRKFWIKYNKPLLQSSDTHNLDTIGTKYSWIKAKTTFEGLKQIVYEPKERIQISQSKPDYKFGYNLIDYIQFKDSNNKNFSTHKIYLNPNLNAIIGGKSTGKSNLLRKIAQKIDIDEFAKDNNSIDWINQDIEIKWNSGNDTDKKILYIPQSFLIKDLEKGQKNIAKIIETTLKGDSKRKNLYERLETEQNNIGITINSELDKLFENGRIEKNKINEIKSIGSKDGLK